MNFTKDTTYIAAGGTLEHYAKPLEGKELAVAKIKYYSNIARVSFTEALQSVVRGIKADIRRTNREYTLKRFDERNGTHLYQELIDKRRRNRVSNMRLSVGL